MPAGMPQIEVTFDIDANGILHVGAKEKSTGKEASIRIENTTTLSKDEIDRMITEAEQNAEADKVRKAKVEKRNTLDSLRIQAEKQIAESAAAPQELKDKVQKLSDEAKDAIQADDDSKIEALQTSLEAALRELMQAAPQNAEGAANAGEPAAKTDEDVIDADFKPTN
jgi:molecular chaperone DnaK